MLGELVSWIETDLPDLLKTLGIDDVPHFDGAVLDGDSSTDRFVEALQKKAGEAASTKFCGDMTVLPCVNHFGKNAGKAAYEFGHRLHSTCSCASVTKADGTEGWGGKRKKHRGLNTDSDPQVLQQVRPGWAHERQKA